MKKKFLAVLSFVFMFALVLFGCSSIHLSNGPSSTDPVYGNGGSAVVKGDYLYFANAFIDYNLLNNGDNVYDKKSEFTPYAIYRTKLNSAGRVVLNDEGVPEKAELLTYNIGGYEYAGLYIFGNYLYYTTPYSNTTSSNETKRGRVRFERVALDGTGHEIVYKADDYTSECEYKMVYIDGNVFIVYKTKDKEIKLISVDARKNVKTSSIATSIESYAVFDQKNIDKDNKVSDVNKYIYYVLKENDEYVMYRANFFTKESEVFMRGGADEIVVKEVRNDRVYYTEGGKLYSRIDSNLVKKYSDISTASDSSSVSSISSYLVLDGTLGNLDRGVIGVLKNDSNYYVTYFNSTYSREIELSDDKSKDVTLIASQENHFFYQISGDDALYRCDLNFDVVSGVYRVENYSTTKIATKFSSTVSDKTMFDFDNDRIYVYEQVDNSIYSYLTMYMTNVDFAFKDGENLVGQYIGNK